MESRSTTAPDRRPVIDRSWVVLVGVIVAIVCPTAPALAADGPSDVADRNAGALEDHPIPPAPSDYIHHEAGWALFVYPRDARGALEPLIEGASEARRAFREQLGQPVLPHVQVRVAQDHEGMEALAPQGLPPGDQAGVVYARYRLIVISLASPEHADLELEELYLHELAHLALFDAVGGRPVPSWFDEGYAVHASSERSLARAQTLWAASFTGDLLPFSELDRVPPERANVAYAQSADFVRFLTRDGQQDRFARMIARVEAGRDFHVALEETYAAPVRSLEKQWRADADERYGLSPIVGAVGLVALVGGIAGALWYRSWRRRRKQALRPRGAPEPRTPSQTPVVRVTLTPRSAADTLDLAALRKAKPIDVPKVEHEGKWHTLH